MSQEIATSRQFLFPTHLDHIDSFCLGSGRFLRAVLVPVLQMAQLRPVVLQPRGTSLVSYLREPTNRCSDTDGPCAAVATYEIDTVQVDGNIHTERVPCYGVLSLSDTSAQLSLEHLINSMRHISIIGVGVTEAGLTSIHSPAVQQLVHLIYLIHQRMNNTSGTTLTCPNPRNRICIINTDNIPNNGLWIQKLVLEYISSQDTYDANFSQFIQMRVVFLNTMVDRITSERPGSKGCVARAEPTPLKALVIEDLYGDLPPTLLQRNTTIPGLVLRHHVGQLQCDIQLKLRIANATHTAVAHAMALSKLDMTTFISQRKDILDFLDTLFGSIRIALFQYDPEEVLRVYQDWRRRLTHVSFGLSTFFITQNGAAKCGIRLGPTILDLITLKKEIHISIAYTIASILRFLTPIPSYSIPKDDPKYVGWLDGHCNIKVLDMDTTSSTCVLYADQLYHNLEQGWYHYRCSCLIRDWKSPTTITLPDALGIYAHSTTHQEPHIQHIIHDYLMHKDGCNLSRCYEMDDSIFVANVIQDLIQKIARIYNRMLDGEGVLSIMQECT